MYNRTVLIGALVGEARKDSAPGETRVAFLVDVDGERLPCLACGDYALKLAPMLRADRQVLVAGTLRLCSPTGPVVEVRAVRFLADDRAGARVAGQAPLPAAPPP